MICLFIFLWARASHCSTETLLRQPPKGWDGRNKQPSYTFLNGKMCHFKARKISRHTLKDLTVELENHQQVKLHTTRNLKIIIIIFPRNSYPEVEAGNSMLSLATYWVWDQPGLHETQSQKEIKWIFKRWVMVAYSYDLQFGASLNYPVSSWWGWVTVWDSVSKQIRIIKKAGTKSHGDALEA